MLGLHLWPYQHTFIFLLFLLLFSSSIPHLCIGKAISESPSLHLLTSEQLQEALKLYQHARIPVSSVNFIYASEGQKSSLRRLFLRERGDLLGSRSMSARSIHHFCQNQLLDDENEEEEENSFKLSGGGQKLYFILLSLGSSISRSNEVCFSDAIRSSAFGRKMFLFFSAGGGEDDASGLESLFRDVGTVNTGAFLLSLGDGREGGRKSSLSEAYKVHPASERIIVNELATLDSNGTARW